MVLLLVIYMSPRIFASYEREVSTEFGMTNRPDGIETINPRSNPFVGVISSNQRESLRPFEVGRLFQAIL